MTYSPKLMTKQLTHMPFSRKSFFMCHTFQPIPKKSHPFREHFYTFHKYPVGSYLLAHNPIVEIIRMIFLHVIA